MSQSYVWVVSWEYCFDTYHKVFTNKVSALNFKYQLENNRDCYEVRLKKGIINLIYTMRSDL